VAVVVFIIFVYANVASCMLIKCALTAFSLSSYWSCVCLCKG